MKEFYHYDDTYRKTKIQASYCKITESGALVFYDENDNVIHAVAKKYWVELHQQEIETK